MRSFPHPLILLIAFILLAGVSTWLVPAGQYARVHDSVSNRETVVPGSYHAIQQTPVGFWSLMLDVPRGIEAGAEIIVSILVFGGAFCVIDRTGAFRAGLLWLIARTGRAPYLVLWLVGLCFAAGGAADNMSEEIIALTPVMVFMAGRLGYSKIGAIAISVGCAVIGSSFSPMNPFQVGIAQKLAELPLLSGAGLRIIFLVPAVMFWIAWVVRRTKGIETAGAAAAVAPQPTVGPSPGRVRYTLILLIVLAAFILMIYGIVRLGWDFNEMTALFFIVGFVCGFIGRLGLGGTALAWAEGAKEMTLAALIVGLARSVYLVLQDGHIIDTIIHAMFTPLQHLPLFLSAAGMMLAHVLIHIPVTSSSGQAQLTIPLLTPLADLTGMSRQVMVLAFQYGQGLTELFSPTNGTLMGVLAVAGVSYKDWGKFVWKPALVLFGIGLVAMAAALATGY
ncbi:MAG TPA: hypothetical protein VL547_22645 [Dinghuibacter sp.]|uniref:YfcC family protein n=1 Tax=Dinghuibacter sp. TaxID=2024697 RepID=UPI002CA5510F|nr:hypothetical protein [Dinghuibacter sp.]HTJ14862.1 hypothetical protein [Dinghuibacter sp.]